MARMVQFTPFDHFDHQIQDELEYCRCKRRPMTSVRYGYSGFYRMRHTGIPRSVSESSLSVEDGAPLTHTGHYCEAVDVDLAPATYTLLTSSVQIRNIWPVHIKW
nr:hypothetical protein CFP56_71596 [Quercus suber]